MNLDFEKNIGSYYLKFVGQKTPPDGRKIDKVKEGLSNNAGRYQYIFGLISS